jgi:hypothetical protein
MHPSRWHLGSCYLCARQIMRTKQETKNCPPKAAPVELVVVRTVVKSLLPLLLLLNSPIVNLPILLILLGVGACGGV